MYNNVFSFSDKCAKKTFRNVFVGHFKQTLTCVCILDAS